METYRLSSKLRDENREYLIQTANDATHGAVATTVYVDGVPTETTSYPHPPEIKASEVLSLVQETHGEKRKEVETLLESYRRVMERGDADMMYHLGTAFFYRGFYAQAHTLFASSVAINPEMHQAHNYLAMSSLALGAYEEALGSARRAVEQRPSYADYRNNLGEILLASGESAQARREFEEAIGINLYYSDAYFNLGLTHIQLAIDRQQTAGWDKTLATINDCLKKASLIYANYQGPAFEEAMSELRSGNLSRAMKLFRAIREEKKERHRREFAAFYMKFVLFPEWVSERTVADRIEFLKREIRRNPTYVDLQAELAHCYLEQAKLSLHKGIEQYGKIAEINPALARVQTALDGANQLYEDITRLLSRVSEKG
jgi:Tfp pilus assembly protein PilF